MTSATSRRARFAVSIALAAVVSVAPAVASAPAAQALPAAATVGTAHATINGVGSTWSANAIKQWTRNVYNNYQWTVNYSDLGSSAGRAQFTLGTADFGVSEIPYALSGSDAPDPRPKRQFAYVPIVAGGTAFMYNLVIGGKRVTNLRLSGINVAKIFTGVITKWNDPAIASDNPKLTLPAIGIVPVVRSDGSGTTAQLTTWMRSQYGNIWADYCARAKKANCGITSNYPVIPGTAFVAQQGSNNEAAYVSRNSSVGAITYLEESYALGAHFPVAKLLNNAGYYTEPNASNVAVSLLAAVINNDPGSPDYLTANLGGVFTNKDPRTYPLSSYSYMIIPTALDSKFTENKGLTLADFASYFLCEGQKQAEVLGYSPLPINLASAGLAQIQKIPGGDPINKDISKCDNPTFSPDGTNKVAATAPQPQACDKKGSDQCLTGTGGAANVSTPSSSSSGSHSSGGSTSGGSTDSPTDAPTDGSAGPNSGNSGGSGGVGGGETIVAGAPIEMPGRSIAPPTLVVMIAAAVLVLVVIFLPPVISRQRAAARARPPVPRVPRRRPARVPRISRVNGVSRATVHVPVAPRKGARAVAPPEVS